MRHGSYHSASISLNQAVGHQRGMLIGKTRLDKESARKVGSLAGFRVETSRGRHGGGGGSGSSSGGE